MCDVTIRGVKAMLGLVICVLSFATVQDAKGARPVMLPVEVEANKAVDRLVRNMQMYADHTLALREVEKRVSRLPVQSRFAATEKQMQKPRLDIAVKYAVSLDRLLDATKAGDREKWPVPFVEVTPERRQEMVEEQVFRIEIDQRISEINRRRNMRGGVTYGSAADVQAAIQRDLLNSAKESDVPVTTCNEPLEDGTKCPRKVAGGGKCYKHR
jgi:hypothetical protein